MLFFRIFSLLFREAVFLAVFMKNMADPLDVKYKCFYSLCNIEEYVSISH